MTWALRPQPAAPSGPQSNPPQPAPTQALSPQGIPPESDLYAGLFRPEGGAPANPNATQVMPPVDPGTAMAPAAYDQPAYDQPIDYQAGGGGHYSEPYDANYAGYAADHNREPAPAPRPRRAAMIGLGGAAGAIPVIVVSLINIRGRPPAPAAPPGRQP